MAQYDVDLRDYWRVVKKRRAIMTFYRQCIQRHLYAFGKHKHYLSKNPYFSSRIQSLDETFPDAIIIYLLRTPIKVLPSILSMIHVGCRQFMSPLDSYPMRDLVVQLVADWYRRPLSYVQRMPAERYIIVQYDSLAEEPARSVKRIYAHFGLDLTACFSQMLEQTKTSSYSSRHAYSLEQTGLSSEQIIEDYQDIFKRLQYKTINDLK